VTDEPDTDLEEHHGGMDPDEDPDEDEMDAMKEMNW
jgi:hypothetical protein